MNTVEATLSRKHEATDIIAAPDNILEFRRVSVLGRPELELSVLRQFLVVTLWVVV